MKKSFFYLLAAIVIVAGLFLKFYTIGAGNNVVFTPTSGATFPQITGTTLTGEDFIVPNDLDRDINLVVIGFKRRHQEDISTWIDAYNTQGYKAMDIGFYEVPVVYEMEFIQRFFLNNAMKFGVTDKTQRERTVTVFLDQSKFLKSMAMDEDKIYALLLDRQGTILWIQEGVYTPEIGQALKTKLSELGSRSAP